jgi:hypothetical protein
LSSSANSTPFSTERIPTEIISQILSSLPLSDNSSLGPYDLLRPALFVCRRWSDIAQALIWKDVRILSISSMSDGDDSVGSPAAEWLEALRDRFARGLETAIGRLTLSGWPLRASPSEIISTSTAIRSLHLVNVHISEEAFACSALRGASAFSFYERFLTRSAPFSRALGPAHGNR